MVVFGACGQDKEMDFLLYLPHFLCFLFHFNFSKKQIIKSLGHKKNNFSILINILVIDKPG